MNLTLCRMSLRFLLLVHHHLETIAATVKDSGGVYFVPALSGLFAPYWRSDARGLITGMSQNTTKAHIVRAALEGICYQTREVDESCPSIVSADVH